ncbi:hypothetical protein PUN28_006080 [Cardiocondyla obscurior]|uniref:Transmembrane protein n=1 Tax=Cardiocondyla obscurior TaxID=286306 RepID=A0AAW2G8V7_9HYME
MILRDMCIWKSALLDAYFSLLSIETVSPILSRPRTVSHSLSLRYPSSYFDSSAPKVVSSIESIVGCQNAAAQVPREYLSAGLNNCILIIVAVTLIVYFFPCWRKLFWNFSWLELALNTELVAFVADDDFLTRTLFLSLPCFLFTLFKSISFCFFLFLSLCLSLYLSILLTVVLFSLPCVRRSFKRANELDQSEFFHAPRNDSFYRAVGLSSFILPPRYLALVVSQSFATFLRWLRSSLRRSNATLRMYFSFAREPHRVSTSFTSAFAVSRSTDDLNATLRS